MDRGDECQQQQQATAASLSAAAVRSFLIGKILLIPRLKKLKAARTFQPQDHASEVSHRALRFGRMPSNALNYGGMYGSGVLLFEGHSWALRKLQAAEADVDTAPAEQSALAGSFGGFLYAITATPVVSLLRMPPYADQSLLEWSKIAILKPLQYTIPRDCGGFALYFGTYTFLRTKFNEDQSSADDFKHFCTTLETKDKYLRAHDDLAMDVLANIGTAMVSGSGAGVSTYLWRSPWDTLYKRSMGWRPADAPLFSSARFLTSPRGITAVAISGTTWAVYEAAILAVTFLEKKGYLQ
ncbi:expressed unknown protein [Seminavis robusta]|uniref:Mitochondrial carrier protein n=1 Tax=Seminavis robusta TaxID=568900 RepID=A0A9N8HEP5_9STRA|nr:expressed unknown protein [Seminavis robusta]|eukprot:Sro526_g160280.1 n/a (297) ;mRNA; r:7452-8342